jgi:hypothetical protein
MSRELSLTPLGFDELSLEEQVAYSESCYEIGSSEQNDSNEGFMTWEEFERELMNQEN